jgi:hypothetical protein
MEQIHHEEVTTLAEQERSGGQVQTKYALDTAQAQGRRRVLLGSAALIIIEIPTVTATSPRERANILEQACGFVFEYRAPEVFALFLQQATLTLVNVASITKVEAISSHHTFRNTRHRYARGGGSRQPPENKNSSPPSSGVLRELGLAFWRGAVPHVTLSQQRRGK